MSNTVIITEETNSTTVNYPVQIGRPFVEGEIVDYPRVSVNGTPVTTQANVKTRWTDGSVRHAVMSFYIPTLSANSSVTVTFDNQASGNETGYSDKTMMLSATYNFDAQIILISGGVTSASARAMISADKYEYWLQGSICTSIIIADHTSAASYDLGPPPHMSFRPIFHATFWPLIGKVKIRYIGEITNTQKLQDMTYALSLSRGNVAPTTVYTKARVDHYAGSRWTKEFWIGDVPTSASTDHNISYLASTKQIFNYDPTKVVSESELSTTYTSFLSSNRDLYDRCMLEKDMGGTGGRPEIAPLNGYAVKWLYTGDVRAKEVAFGNAHAAAAWPVHLREGNPTKNIQGSTNGLGKVISIRNRPTFTSHFWTNVYQINDAVTIVKTLSANDWRPDLAHIPDMDSALYLLTGDYWYLEQLYFFAAYAAAYDNGAAFNETYGRGPTGAEGGPRGQLRAQAWNLRTRATAAAYAPDGTIEKTYFTTLLDDAFAGYEAERGISGTSYTNNAMYVWARSHWVNALNSNPTLNQWDYGEALYADASYGINVSATSIAVAQFFQHFHMLALGRCYELGFHKVAPILNYLSRFYIGALTEPDYNPYLLANGRLPTVRVSDGQYFDTWANLKTGYNTTWQNTSAFPKTDPVHGYDFLAMAATSYVSGAGSLEAWTFMEEQALPAPLLDNTPTWAIISRGDLLTGDPPEEPTVDDLVVRYGKRIRINI